MIYFRTSFNNYKHGKPGWKGIGFQVLILQLDTQFVHINLNSSAERIPDLQLFKKLL